MRHPVIVGLALLLSCAQPSPRTIIDPATPLGTTPVPPAYAGLSCDSLRSLALSDPRPPGIPGPRVTREVLPPRSMPPGDYALVMLVDTTGHVADLRVLSSPTLSTRQQADLRQAVDLFRFVPAALEDCVLATWWHYQLRRFQGCPDGDRGAVRWPVTPVAPIRAEIPVVTPTASHSPTSSPEPPDRLAMAVVLGRRLIWLLAAAVLIQHGLRSYRPGHTGEGIASLAAGVVVGAIALRSMRRSVTRGPT